MNIPTVRELLEVTGQKESFVQAYEEEGIKGAIRVLSPHIAAYASAAGVITDDTPKERKEAIVDTLIKRMFRMGAQG